MTTPIQDINVIAKELGAAKTVVVGQDSGGNPVALKLNADGTMAGGGGDASLAEQQTQTTHLAAIEAAVEQIGVTRYVAISNWISKIAFTDVAAAGITIQNFRVIDLNTSATLSSVWTNLATEVDLDTPPEIDVEIEYIGGTAVTLAEMQSLGIATESTLNSILGVLNDAQAISYGSLVFDSYTGLNNLDLPVNAVEAIVYITDDSNIGAYARLVRDSIPIDWQLSSGENIINVLGASALSISGGGAPAAGVAFNAAWVFYKYPNSNIATNQLPATLGQKTSAGSLSVTQASDDVFNVAFSGQVSAYNEETGAVMAGVIADGSGVAYAGTLHTDFATGELKVQDVRLPATLGEKAGSVSLSVVPASDAIFDFKPTTNNRSAFADHVTVPRTPINQHGFTHGLYADNVLFGASGAGAATTTSNGRLSLTSGTASGGFAWFSSERPIIYRQGQGVCDRFTCIFGAPAANIMQFKGVASYATATPSVPIDAMGFCYYVGTALTNGTPTAYTGTTFGILHRNFSSGSTVDTFYPQSEWNIDKLDGTGLSGETWDKTKGNLVEVLYGYQGYSGFVFLWYLPDEHEYIVCHQIPYANANTNTHFSNPNVMHYELMINSAAVTATTMFCGSVASFLDGERTVTNRPLSFDNGTPTANINGFSSICAIQMATTFNGAPVRGIARILGISVACLSGNGIIRTLIGATVTGQTTFAAIEPATATVTGSSGAYTIATSGGAGTFASCPVLGNTTVGAVTATPKVQGKGVPLAVAAVQYIDLSNDNVYITAGQVFTVAANTAANATFTASIHFVVEI